jgi:perosamine synthetase
MATPENDNSRRRFLKNSSLVGLGAVLGAGISPSVFAAGSSTAKAPAVLGGQPAWAKSKWVKWPIWNPETDEKKVLEVLRSGVWSRSTVVNEFEKEWAKTLGAAHCLTTTNGTNALIVAINQFKIGAGDEVLVTPYTFIATIQAILANGAMPVFVDVDRATFQIDPAKIEAKITSRTKAIMPVHILGLPADMDSIMAIAKKHNLLVIEDACQAPLAEVNHKKVGTIGNAGCYSFQNSKNIAIGEGGAIVSNDLEFIDRCFSYHNLGLPYGTAVSKWGPGGIMHGGKTRMTEYQAAIGLAQLQRLDAQTTTRNQNAAYLKGKIQQVPGITPYKLYDNVTRAAFHLFGFRMDESAFKGLTRDNFVAALRAEGIPVSTGYTPLNTQPFIRETFETAGYKKSYPKKELDYNVFLEKNACPQNEKLCTEMVWITQNVLLNSKEDLDTIADAIEKIHANAESIQQATVKNTAKK